MIDIYQQQIILNSALKTEKVRYVWVKGLVCENSPSQTCKALTSPKQQRSVITLKANIEERR